MLRLYDSSASGNAYKVRLLLHQLALAHERVELDIDAGETRTGAYLSKNPNGKIPAVELDSGEILCESDAILFYFAEGTEFLPDDRLARAQSLQWMFFEQYSHEPYIAVARYIRTHLEHTPENELAAAQKLPRGYEALDVMEQHLEKRRFFVSEQYGIADIALYAYTHVAHEGGFDLEGYPAIRRWLERVQLQPRHLAIDTSA